MMNRKIIVFGATGKTGQAICKELESNHLYYTVFVRGTSAHKLVNDAIPAKTGDVMNFNDVLKAFENATYTDVIIALGSKDIKNATLRSTGTKNIIDAMQKTQSNSHIHVISALGVGESQAQLTRTNKLFVKFILKKTMLDHSLQETYLKNSSIPVHIIRPVGLRDGEGQGEVHVQNEGFLPGNVIQRADVAKYLVECLLENKTGVSSICAKK